VALAGEMIYWNTQSFMAYIKLCKWTYRARYRGLLRQAGSTRKVQDIQLVPAAVEIIAGPT
jgi:hypothetical protein